MIFAPNGRAAITYRVEIGVCLASGDPVGDPSAWPQAITAWLALCQEYGWAPGVMGASSAAAEVFREAGLNALQLGDEAILYPEKFRLSGPNMRAVRQAVTRARRAGLTVRMRRHQDLPAEEMAAVVKRADAWRDTETERGFSMALGRLGDPADGDCLLVEAIGQDGQSVAMLSLVPWGSNGLSLDLMRRSPQSQRNHRADGERVAAERGNHWRQSRFAELRHVPFGLRAGLSARRGPGGPAVARVLVFFSRWWQLETLYRSNMKYLPQWVPRYACYDDARLIAKVGVASVIAEGFLVLPFSRRNRQHTGHHPAVPSELAASGRLQADGSRTHPGTTASHQPPMPTSAAARAGAGPAGQAESTAGQRHRRLSGGPGPQPHGGPGTDGRRRRQT